MLLFCLNGFVERIKLIFFCLCKYIYDMYVEMLCFLNKVFVVLERLFNM